MNADALARCEMMAATPVENRITSCRRSRGDISLLHLFCQGGAIVGLILGSYLFFSHFVVQSVRVSGASMVPTLHDSDFYIMNRLAALFRAPRRGDIVVLKDPTDQTYAVKRVIGTAGDLVDLRDGSIYVNGRLLQETYLPKGTRTYPFTCWRQIVQCGADQCFVLGDNRSYSSDSRCYGPVSRKSIQGFLVR